MKSLSQIYKLTCCLILATSCGGNVFESTDKPKEENNLDSASRALEDGNPDKAIEILEGMLPADAKAAVNNDPEDPEFEAKLVSALGDDIEANKPVLATLARAYPEKQGVNLLDMVARLNAAQKKPATTLALVEDDPLTTFLQLVPDSLSGDYREVGLADINRGIRIANVFLSLCVVSLGTCPGEVIMIDAIVNMVGFAASLENYDFDENGRVSADEAGEIPYINGVKAYNYAKTASLRLGDYAAISPDSADIRKAKCKFDDAVGQIDAQSCVVGEGVGAEELTGDECTGLRLVRYLVCTSGSGCPVARCNGG